MQPTDDAPVAAPIEIHVVGPLSTGTLRRVRATFDQAAALHPERIVVDLAACDFVDAAGIGLLAEMHQQVSSAGGRLTIRGASTRLFRALEAATMLWMLRTTPSSPATLTRMRAW